MIWHVEYVSTDIETGITLMVGQATGSRWHWFANDEDGDEIDSSHRLNPAGYEDDRSAREAADEWLRRSYTPDYQAKE